MSGELDALLKVSAQLEALQRQVNQLAENATRKAERGEDAGDAKRSSSHHLPKVSSAPVLTKMPSSLALDTASSDDDSHYVRPSHYPHAPTSRLDALETNNFSETPLMEALKLDSFSGFYNLSLFLLFFAFAYLIVRSFREKGSQITLSDFTCEPLRRDVIDAAIVITGSYLWSFGCYVALRTWIYKRISWRVLTYCYLFLQAVLLLGPVLFIYSTPIAPMPAAAVLMVAIVLGLKLHSYVFTNWAIYNEHVRRYGTSLLDNVRKTGISAVNTTAAAAGASSESGPGGEHAGGSQSARKGSARSKSGKQQRKAAGAAGALKDKDSGPEDASDDDNDDNDDDDGAVNSVLVPSSSSRTETRRRIGGKKKGQEDEDPARTRSTSHTNAALAMASKGADEDDEGSNSAFGAGGGAHGPAASPRSDFLRRQQQSKKGALTAATPNQKSAANTGSSTGTGTLSARKDSLESFSLAGGNSSGAGAAAAQDAAAAGSAEPPSPGAPLSAAGAAKITLSPAERRHAVKSWPHNVTMRDFAYFVAAPTLVYEPRFPRTRRRRWSYVARKLLEMALCFALQYVVMRQFMIPVLKNPSQPRNLDDASIAHGYYGHPDSATRHVHHTLAHAGAFVFDMMKLAIPSLLVWLLGFYAMFHCWLNLLAELLRFADRTFFLDFWNSTTLDAFWRKWNIPVHEWCLRHVYLDLQTYSGVNKSAAVLATFFFSAVFHELIFSVAFKTFRPWFFIGMLAQIPLISLGRGWKNKRRGNYLVWWSLFSGQPLLEMLYFREFFSNHASFFCVTEAAPVAVAVDKLVTTISALGASNATDKIVAAAASAVAAAVGAKAGQ